MISLRWIFFLYVLLGTHIVTGVELFTPLTRNKNMVTDGTTSWIEYRNKLCPYNNYCNSPFGNFSIPVDEIAKDSLCQPCECSSICWTNNCCTDPPKVVSVCRDQSSLFNGPRTLKDISSTAYYVIDRCAESYAHARIIAECLEPKELLDFILVSDKDQRIYKNRKCAQCNNVDNFIYWDLVTIVNVSILDHDIITITKTIVSELPVYSRPSGSLPMSSLASYRCHPEALSSCNITQQWLKYDAELEELCLTSGRNTYAGDYYGLPVLYSNVFCFLCNKDTDSNYQTRSTYFDFVGLPGGIEWKTDLMIIFNTSKLVLFLDEIKNKSVCKVDEIFDSFMEKCRKLLCPTGSVAVYGVCDRDLFHVDGLATSIVFELAASHLVTIDNGKRLHYKDIRDTLIKEFNLGNLTDVCGICRTLFYQKDQSLQMFAEFQIQITGICRETFITDTVSHIARTKGVLIGIPYLFHKINYRAKLSTDFKRTGVPVVFMKGQSPNLCEWIRRNNSKATLISSPSILLAERDIEGLLSRIGSFASQRLRQSLRNDSSGAIMILDDYMTIIKDNSNDKTKSIAVRASIGKELLLTSIAILFSFI